MSDLFDLSNFDKYKEDNCREVKKAEGGLPIPHLPILMVVLLFLALESGRMELGILLDLRMRINLRETFGTQFMIPRR